MLYSGLITLAETFLPVVAQFGNVTPGIDRSLQPKTTFFGTQWVIDERNHNHTTLEECRSHQGRG